jgi:hypothetical protein
MTALIKWFLAYRKWRRDVWPGCHRWYVLAGVVALGVGWRLTLTTLQTPSSPWLAYHWFAYAVLVGAAVWTIAARQRKDLWGDKAFRFWLWHYFTGAPLVVVDNPDLPWWEDVRRCWPFLDTTRSEPCPEFRRWSCYLQRALVGLGRTTLVASLILVEYLRSGAPHGTAPLELATWGIGGTLAAAAFCYAVARSAIGWARWCWWYRTLHIALARRAGWWRGKRPRSWIRIPRDFVESKAIRLRLALDYLLSSDNKTKTLELVAGILGLRLEDIDIEWDPVGKREFLYVRKAKRIPDLVRLSNAEVLAAVDAVKGRWDYVVGFTAGWPKVIQSIEKQAPHILIAGPSKTGKSQLLKVILWQLLRKNRDLGAPLIFVLDIKGDSHQELEGRPGVVYCTTPEQMIAALLRVIAIGVERREKARAAYYANKPRPTFPPCFVIFEDMGAAFTKIKSDDARQAWDDILSLGRNVAIHAIAMPHRPDMKYLGGGAVRDNLGNRMLMSGHTKGAKRMVADDVEYDLPAEKRGRFVLFRGLEAIHVQGILDDAGLIEAELDDLLGRQVLPAADQEPEAATADRLDHVSAGSRLAAPQHDPASDVPLEHRVPVGELAGPAGQWIPGGAEAVGDVRSRLITTSQNGKQTTDDAGLVGGAHATILTGVRAGRPGESAAEPAGEGHTTRPTGATPLAPQAPPSAGSTLPAAGARPALSPGDAGVMAAPPQSPENPLDPSAQKPHPPSRSWLGDPGGVGASSGVNGNGGDPEAGPDPVTLREAHARKLVGVGLEYESVRTRFKRASRAVAEGTPGAWVPQVIGVRMLPNGSKVREFDSREVVRWWAQGNKAAPDDGRWWCYFMVQGGLPAVRYGCIVKIGWTNDLERRCADFGNHYPGDVIYSEQFGSEAEARAAEKRYHRRWTPETADGRGSAPAGASLRRYPQGGGGKGGREQFWCEGTLADFMAEHAPERRQEAV